MRLLIRLSLTILSMVLLLGSVYLLLPNLLSQFVEVQLSRQGFHDIDLQLGELGMQTATVEHLRMANQDVEIELYDLAVSFRFERLLKGVSDKIQVGQLEVTRLNSEAAGELLPDPSIFVTLLAQPWQEMLPFNALVLEDFRLLEADGGQVFNARGELRRTGNDLEGRFALTDSRQQSYTIDLTLLHQGHADLVLRQQVVPGGEQPLLIHVEPDDEGKGINGQVVADLADLSRLMGAGWASAGRFQAGFSYLVGDGNTGKRFRLAGDLQGGAFSDLTIAQLRARLEGSIEEQGEIVTIEFSPVSRISVEQLKQAQNSVASAQISMPAKVRLAPQGVTIEDSQGALALNEIRLDTLEVSHADIENIGLEMNYAPGQTPRCGFHAQLDIATATIAAQRITATPLQLDGSCPLPGNPVWAIAAQGKQVDYEDEDYRFSLSQCNLMFGNAEQGRPYDPDPMEMGGQLACLHSGIGGSVDARVRLNPVTSVGRMDFSLADIQADVNSPLPGSLFKQWAQPFDIVSGKISLQGVYRWWLSRAGRTREKLSLNVAASDLGGHYQEILFSGLDYSGSIDLLPKIETADFQPLTIAHIDLGIPIENSSAEFRLDGGDPGGLPVARIDHLRIPLFDGEIRGNDIVFDPNTATQEIVLHAQGLDMAKIVDTQNIDNLSVSGRLDGTLPITIAPAGASVNAGKIVAQAPGGYIRYHRDDAEKIQQAAPGSELLIDILEDLQYHSLEVGLDYQADGEMDLSLAIKGYSPKVDSKRPVHLNLNLQQNLLTLLRGLRYAEGISKGIDQNVERFMNKRLK